jgi:hypothetical protein
MATWTPPGLFQTLLFSCTSRSNCAHVTPRFEQTSGWLPLGGAFVATPEVKTAPSGSWRVRFERALPVDPKESASCAAPHATSPQQATSAEQRVIEECMAGSFEIGDDIGCGVAASEGSILSVARLNRNRSASISPNSKGDHASILKCSNRNICFADMR